VIKNERQYAITRAQAEKFERALRDLTHRSGPAPGVPPALRKAEEDALRSQLADLRAEIAEYEALRSGQRTVLNLASLDELPRTLIQARIASGMTQKELADKLGLKEQQIQRYEATEYASASLTRVLKVLRACQVELTLAHEEVRS
jgi:ribosome-binding protein aMBF1 (putative translation factor)